MKKLSLADQNIIAKNLGADLPIDAHARNTIQGRVSANLSCFNTLIDEGLTEEEIADQFLTIINEAENDISGSAPWAYIARRGEMSETLCQKIEDAISATSKLEKERDTYFRTREEVRQIRKELGIDFESWRGTSE